VRQARNPSGSSRKTEIDVAFRAGRAIAMRALRFSIAGLMGIIVLVALGTAAVRYSSETTAAIVSLVTHAVLSLAIVGAVCRSGAERTWWLGFAALGWMYLGLPFRSLYASQTLVSRVILKMLARLAGVPIANVIPGDGDLAGRWFFWIGHNLLALLAAIIGGLLAGAIFGAATARSLETTVSDQTGRPVSRRWWVLPVVIVLSGLALTGSIAIACSRFDPGLWAGSTYLITWWLIGLTALGALFGRGRRREFWLGATFLGASFLIAVFNRPPNDPDRPRLFLPTVEFLEAIRPSLAALESGFSTDPKGFASTSAHIARALSQNVPIEVSDGTTLADFLKQVQQATRRPSGEVIPIYVEPIGLQEAERSMTSTLHGVHLEGVPLRTSLRLCLKQLDLAYLVRDGMLVITSQESEDDLAISPNDDPYQIVGHCLLALIGAALGGLVTPLVCDLARSTAERRTGLA
jgi:hypothetical protein